MNYLAHLYLSGDDPERMIGGLLGDFVKGPLKGEYPARVEEGIRLHRSIDAWVDQQPEIRLASARFEPPFRRFGGVIVDIYYDHLLATRWSDYHLQPLPEYAKLFYGYLQRSYQWLPEGAQRFTDNAPRVGLLEGYIAPDAVTTALMRISKRLRRPIQLELAAPQIERDRVLLQQEFEKLFPRLKTFAKTTLQTF